MNHTLREDVDEAAEALEILRASLDELDDRHLEAGRLDIFHLEHDMEGVAWLEEQAAAIDDGLGRLSTAAEALRLRFSRLATELRQAGEKLGELQALGEE